MSLLKFEANRAMLDLLMKEKCPDLKIGCVIHYWGESYEGIGQCAVRSFRKFHPDVDIYHLSDKNEELFKSLRRDDTALMGSKRLLVAQELMRERGYEKVIILGADTITCARLEEFLTGEKDILATWDLDYPLITERFITQIHQQHINADVVCFNNVVAIDKILEVLPHYPEEQYGEQGALNEVFHDPTNGITGVYVEGPPPILSFYVEGREDFSTCCYNVRSKSTFFTDQRDEHGNRHFQYNKVICESANKPWTPYVSKFQAVDDKLYTGDARQIKVWHYCDGFGSEGVDMEGLINKWKTEIFNEETKKFFREHCDCAEFFPEE